MTLPTALIDLTSSPNQARLSADEAYHLLRVRRIREGESFRGVDGEGSRYQCLLEKDGHYWSARILSTLEEEHESPLNITLAQSLIKKDPL